MTVSVNEWLYERMPGSWLESALIGKRVLGARHTLWKMRLQQVKWEMSEVDFCYDVDDGCFMVLKSTKESS